MTPINDRRPARRHLRLGLVALAASSTALALPTLAAAAPAAPTGLQVKATGPKQVALTWTASTTPVTGYRVYRNGVAIATRDEYTTKHVDLSASLVNGTTYTYTVAAFDGTGTSSPSAGVAGQPENATPLAACETSDLGVKHVVLTADLTSSAATPCLSFAGSSNQSLDCNGHTITQYGLGAALAVRDVDGFIVSNCTFKQNRKARITTVKRGSFAYFVSNRFESGPAADQGNAATRLVEFENSDSPVVGLVGRGNTFVDIGLQLTGAPNPSTGRRDNGSPNALVSHNTFTDGGFAPYASIWIHRGDGSVVVHNTIDGGNPGAPAPASGLDDGIVLTMNDGLTVSENVISNTWDAGIDSGGVLSNSKIDHNTIRNVDNAGFGTYHVPSVTNNSFRGNRITRAASAFRLRPQRSATPGIDENDSRWVKPDGLRIVGNEFVGNVLLEPVRGTNWYTEPFMLTGAILSPGEPFVAHSNVFRDNDFGVTERSPDVSPATATTYALSTGNRCLPSVSIQCTTP